MRVSGVMWAAMESVRGVCAVRERCVCGVCERCACVGVVLSACVSTPREECVFHFSIVSHVTRGVPRRRVPTHTRTGISDTGDTRPLVDGVLVSWETQAYETRARVRLSSETLGPRL